ncbi:MAG TPA: sulfite exporter TauE/SafE family protein [Candidatus Dormibacteraeota bacterium]|nr:sulfite exporter TauE/SafE family protein [Candidatus Dormibacteraeota bacterium]
MLTTLVLLVAGFVAGSVNSVAGGGSLLTFPTLLALGYPALQANVTNTVGVFPGNLGGVTGYRRELAGQRDILVRCFAAGMAGSVLGSALLLHTSEAAFRRVVPWLIVVASAVVLMQPLLTRRLRAMLGARGGEGAGRRGAGLAAPAAVGILSVYGGYFGAAVGVMLIAALVLFHVDTLQRINALKTALTLAVNGTSSLVFAFFAPVAWGPAATIATGTIAGGYAGAGLARRLPDTGLRAAMVAIGVTAAVVVAVRG